MDGFRATVTERLSWLLETGKYSDVEFRLDNGEKVKGHKLIYAICSPMFESMFLGGVPEKNVVKVEDIDPEAFQTMTKFIYTDRLKLNSVSHAVAVHKASSVYILPRLLKLTHDYIDSNFKAEDALEVYECGTVYDNPTLVNRSIQLIRKNTEAVLNSEKFYNCSLTTLEMIVNEEELSISEITLFNYIEKWANNFAKKEAVPLDSLRHLLNCVVSRIRFLSMSLNDFIASPYRSDLLTSEEKHCLLTNFSQPSKTPMPSGFTASSSPRSAGSYEYHKILEPLSLNSSQTKFQNSEATSSFHSLNYQARRHVMPSKGKVYGEDLKIGTKKTPLGLALKNGFPPSSRISFSGVVLNSAERFNIDFLCYDQTGRAHTDIALHFNPRFSEKIIVRNSKTSGSWGREERDGPLAFSEGSTFELDIRCTENTFLILINGYVKLFYQHRINPRCINHVAVYGAVDIYHATYYSKQA